MHYSNDCREFVRVGLLPTVDLAWVMCAETATCSFHREQVCHGNNAGAHLTAKVLSPFNMKGLKGLSEDLQYRTGSPDVILMKAPDLKIMKITFEIMLTC